MTSRAKATKQKLFEATLRLSSSRGLVGLTVDDIAAEAGVAKGTGYDDFGSKDGLIDALLRYGVGQLAGRGHRRGSTGDHRVPSGQYAGVHRGVSGISQILVSEMWRTPGQWHETLTLLREEIISIVKEQLRRSSEAGRLPEGVEIQTAAAGLFGTMLVVALDWQVFQPGRSPGEVRDSVMLLVRGMAR